MAQRAHNQHRVRRATEVHPGEGGHDLVRAQLSEYLANRLDTVPRERVAAHLTQCPDCATVLATLRRTVELLGALPLRPAPNGLPERLLALSDDQRSPELSAAGTDPSLAADDCPPHYWWVDDQPHAWQHLTCRRCGAKREQPRARAGLSRRAD
jgi:hypothetical protein